LYRTLCLKSKKWFLTTDDFIRLFIFNTHTWCLKYINVSIKINAQSIKSKKTLRAGLMEQIKVPEILILADIDRAKLITLQSTLFPKSVKSRFQFLFS